MSFTLASVLERHALDPRRRDRPAFTQGGERRTFAGLHERARRLAASLPVEKGDRVAVLMGNRLEWVDVLFGVTGAGAVCVPVNVLLAGADVVAVVADAAPRVLVADAHAASALASLAAAGALPPTVVTVGTVETPAGADRVDLALRDDSGEITPEGEGEIVLRSPATTTGYYGRLEENATVVEGEHADRGWFHTGDLGRLDADGYLTVTGRTKDMIITGGLNIAPREIEDVVAGAPGVREVAVVGIPDPRFGEAPVAGVVTSPDDSVAVVEDAVRRACEQGLSGYKRPRRVVVGTEELPKTVTGKVLERELRERLADPP